MLRLNLCYFIKLILMLGLNIISNIWKDVVFEYNFKFSNNLYGRMLFPSQVGSKCSADVDALFEHVLFHKTYFITRFEYNFKYVEGCCLLLRWGPNVQQTSCIAAHLESQGGNFEQSPLVRLHIRISS